MNKITRNLITGSLTFFILSILIVSCDKEVNVGPPDIAPEFAQQDENFVSLNEVTAIASVLEYSILPNSKDDVSAKGGETASKEIQSTKKVRDENGDISYYIINYAEGGFVIISADDRANPILAFSETNNFSLKKSKDNEGLTGWMDDTKANIKHLRETDAQQTEEQAQTWQICDVQAVLSRIPLPGDCDDDGGGDGDGDGGGCVNTTFTRGPLLSTKWHQYWPFNEALAPITSGCIPATGCVATAMAQIMKFHEYPNNYDWDAMADDSDWFAPETAGLMLDIGGATLMQYLTCDLSATTSYEGTSSLTTDFGYSSASIANFNIFTVKAEIQANRPVLLWGEGIKKKDGEIPDDGIVYGHTWVSDGYRNIYNCETGLTYLYLHMNWGWGGWQDGYYYYWNTREYNFDTGKLMTYNIKP